MSNLRPGRAALRLGGITLAAAAALAGVGGTAAAAPEPTRTGLDACTWAAQVLPTVPTTDLPISVVNGTDGDRTFAGFSNGHAVLWRDGRLIDLGPGGAKDVNRRGEAVGIQADAGDDRATLFRAGRAIPLAEPAGAAATRATGINDDGLIVGTAEFLGQTTGTTHAVIWSARTPHRVTDLGTLDGDEAKPTWLTGVNERGELAGYALDQTLGTVAVTGTVQGGLRALPTSSPGASTEANAIAGRYIAGAQNVDGVGQAVRWVNGRLHFLPGDGSPQGVNSSGTVVGHKDYLTPVLWNDGRDPVELPAPTGDPYALATVITDQGLVGGYSINDISMAFRPVLWSCR